MTPTTSGYIKRKIPKCANQIGAFIKNLSGSIDCKKWSTALLLIFLHRHRHPSSLVRSLLLSSIIKAFTINRVQYLILKQIDYRKTSFRCQLFSPVVSVNG